jgi:hypothetical protein
MTMIDGWLIISVANCTWDSSKSEKSWLIWK